MAIKKKEPQYKTKPGYVFNTPFEQLKALGYLRNLINSPLLQYKTSDLANFAGALLGQKQMITAIKEVCPEYLDSPEFKTAMEYDDTSIALPVRELRKLLSRIIVGLIEKKVITLSGGSETPLERRLKMLRASFHLKKVEIELLLFLYLKATIPSIDNALNVDRHGIMDFSLISRIRSHGHILLGVGRSDIHKALSEGTLLKSQALERCGNNSVSISNWCLDYLLGIGAEDLSLEFFSIDNEDAMRVDDFAIAGDEMTVLDTLMKSRERQNIFLYGSPGSGKTSFARSLAKTYKKMLLNVKVPSSGDHNDRLRAVYAAVNLANKQKAVVLVDEADEILNTYNSPFFKSVTQKSWINAFLDQHDKKIIWIANRSDQIDPSTMRRFSFSLEFKKIDREMRMKILKYQLAKNGVEKEYFSEEELTDLCKSHAVDAGGIVNAVRTVALNKAAKKESAITKIKTILKNHEKATGGSKTASGRERTFDRYTIEGLNASCDLQNIMSGLKQYIGGSAKSVSSVSLLLYGLPGTGKTEFVYYLGSVLRKDVVLKRASDIQSKWVGETEKNIAKAFSEAGENDSILFFDEADSFLFPRADAQRSWEISHTNEILTQLENFKGIVVFATNDIDGLDHAALRRFRFKVRFDPLTAEGNLLFYKSYLMSLVMNSQAPDEQEIGRLKSIKNLTPGDFAVVKDQFEFLRNQEVSHDMLITALINEAMHKRCSGLKIGF